MISLFGTLGTIAIFAGILVALAFFGCPFLLGTIALCAWLVAPAYVWVPLAILAVVFYLPPLRRVLISNHILAFVNKIKLFPPMSETERTALEAGTVWVDKDLFSGKPDLRKLAQEHWCHEVPADVQEFLDGPVEEVCSMMDDWKAFREMDLPDEVWEFLKRHGFFGLIIGKEHGGRGFGAAGTSAVVHKLASRSFPLSVTVMIPNSLGPAELLSHYGTEKQKELYLPRLADGRDIPCFALTEPTAGSDAGSIRASGVVFRGDDGEPRIKLNFDKRYISLATRATLVGLAFKLKDPEELLGKGKFIGITCALIPSETPGLDLSQRHDPLGVPFYNCPVRGDDVVIDVEQIIGGPDGAGHGWRMLMDCLSAGRGVALPASSVAGAKISARVAGAYSRVRKQFGMPIGNFEGIEEPLARLAGRAYIMDAARVFTCAGIDAGEKPSVLTAIAKYNQTELIRESVNDAMDIIGGAGISRGPRNLMAGMYMGVPIGITVEGANILTRSMIIFGQGAVRCHPWALEEMNAARENDGKTFDRALWGHVGHIVRNATRATLLTLTRGWLVLPPTSGPTARYWRRLSWASASFAILTDIAMAGLGGQLKRREKLTGRFADILSWMYLATATLRRFEAEGKKESDVRLMKWSMETCFERIQEAFDGLYPNFPLPVVGTFFRRIAAPWSRLNSFGPGPGDRLGAAAASAIRDESPLRTRLTSGLFVPSDETEALGRLETAFGAAIAADEPTSAIRAAMRAGTLKKGAPESRVDEAVEAGVIDVEGGVLVGEAARLREDLIQVDSFPADEFKKHVALLPPEQLLSD